MKSIQSKSSIAIERCYIHELTSSLLPDLKRFFNIFDGITLPLKKFIGIIHCRNSFSSSKMRQNNKIYSNNIHIQSTRINRRCGIDRPEFIGGVNALCSSNSSIKHMCLMRESVRESLLLDTGRYTDTKSPIKFKRLMNI